MSSFSITIWPVGLPETELHVDSAIEDTDARYNLLCESVAESCHDRWEECQKVVPNYVVCGQFESTWRENEEREKSWCTQPALWLVVRGELPNGAQAVVRKLPPHNQVSNKRTAAPVHFPRQTSDDKKENKSSNKVAEDARKRQKEELKVKTLENMEKQKEELKAKTSKNMEKQEQRPKTEKKY